MTDSSQDAPENNHDPGSDDDFLMSSSGMTMGRFRQIKAAEDQGEPLDLSDEELAQYEQTKIEVAELNARLRKVMNKTFEPYNERIKNIIRDSLPRISVHPPKLDLSPKVPRVKKSMPAADPEWFESVAAATTEKAEQEAENSRNIGRMAASAQDMLSILSEQKDILDGQKGLMDDQKVAYGKQGEADTNRHRQMMWVMVPTLLVTIAALVATIVLNQ